MREIKFRAWNKILKQFVPIWSAIETRGDNVLRPINYGFIIEQYTGLKEKNGVEIYENDIIHVQSHLYKDHIGAIIWSQGTAGFCVSDNTNEFNIPRPLGIQMDGFLSYEVIGNIHENTDLLEEQS